VHIDHDGQDGRKGCKTFRGGRSFKSGHDNPRAAAIMLHPRAPASELKVTRAAVLTFATYTSGFAGTGGHRNQFPLEIHPHRLTGYPSKGVAPLIDVSRNLAARQHPLQHSLREELFHVNPIKIIAQ